MPRTDEARVKAVISTSLATPQINAFIEDSSLWVTEELGGQELSGERLELVERYLTCALIRLRDLGLKSATLDDVTEHYQANPEVTDYLLRAASFDPTGRVQKTFLISSKGGASESVASNELLFRVGSGFAAERSRLRTFPPVEG